MHHIGRNERGVAGAENALLAIDPLLDLAGDDEDHLFLVGVLMEIVALAGSEADIDDGELPAPVLGGLLSQRNVPQSSTWFSTSLAMTNFPDIGRPLHNADMF